MRKIEIKLNHLRKSYETPILRDINLELDNNSYIAILGESGAGKSTLLNILGLVERYDDGEYIFNDVLIGENKDYSDIRLEYIGFIFQSYNLIPTLTCRENIELPLLYHRRNVDIGELTYDLGIDHLLDRNISVLSGGEKQRVAIARALILNPSIIIADEPTGNLDAKNRDRVFEILRKEHAKGRAVVMITHDREAAKQAEKQYYLRQGELYDI